MPTMKNRSTRKNQKGKRLPDSDVQLPLNMQIMHDMLIEEFGQRRQSSKDSASPETRTQSDLQVKTYPKILEDL